MHDLEAAEMMLLRLSGKTLTEDISLEDILGQE